jgi:hypothetical protein
MWAGQSDAPTPQQVAVFVIFARAVAYPGTYARSGSSDGSMGSTMRATLAQSAVSASVTAGADT